MNYKVLAGGALVIIPMIGLLWGAFGTDPKALPSQLEGREAPDFSLQSIDGQQVSLSSVAGTPTVLNFWASWCGPCVQEHPVLLAGARAYGDKVKFYGVLYADEQPKAEVFLKRHGSGYPTLLDPSGRTALDYGVAGVPETFFLSSDGRIVKKVVGPVDPTTLRTTLEQLL